MAEKSFESGIDIQYITRFLRDELALASTGAGEYRYKGIDIRVTPLPPRRLGSFSMQRNQIDLSGDEGDIKEFEHAFLMRFLSAGG